MQWNIRSFTANKPLLQCAIQESKPNLICLQETRVECNKELRLPGYSLGARMDRLDNKGGGVSVHVDNAIPFTPIGLKSKLEVAAVLVHLKEYTFTLCTLYLHPKLKNGTLDEELTLLLRELHPPFIICMDANAHHRMWGSPAGDCRGRLIVDIVERENLWIANNGHPTYLSNSGKYTHIDITIVSKKFASSLAWNVSFENYTIDHFPIIIDTNAKFQPTKLPPKWKFAKADWNLYQQKVKLPKEVGQSTTEDTEKIELAIKLAASASIPKTSGIRNTAFTKCWWTEECTKALREKKRAYNRQKRHRGDMRLWCDFKRAQAKFRYIVKNAKKKSWMSFVSTINKNTKSRDVWRKVGQIRGKSANSKIKLKINNRQLTETLDIVEAFAEDFSTRGHASKGTQQQFKVIRAAENTQQKMWYNEPFNMTELREALHNSRSTSPGPDDIPVDLLQKLGEDHLQHLLNHYNNIWQTNIPDQWKKSVIIPLHKPNKVNTDTTSYRPVSLTNNMCKIFEKMVNKRLICFLEQKNWYNKQQSAFRARHSTYDALFRLEECIKNSMIKYETVVAVFIDIDQAFDSVSHVALLEKVERAGVLGNMRNFIKDFISGRSIRVRIEDIQSTSHEVTAGVPQGSVVSPTLFNIMINDITQNIHEEVEASIYADDCALWVRDYKVGKCITLLQGALDRISSWSKQWGLQISASKSKAVIFSRRRKLQQIPLKLDDVCLEYVKQHKFLGIIFDSKNTFQPHIKYIKEKCGKDLRLLEAVSSHGWGADSQTLRRLYVSLIRAKLEYASFVYANASVSLLKTLDRVQYAAARTILGMLKCTPTNTLEAEANLMPLDLCRKQNLIQYAIRIASIPAHPVKAIIQNYYPYQFYKEQRMPLPISETIVKECKSMGILHTSIPIVAQEANYTYYQLPVYNTLATYKKENMSPSQWSGLFKDLLEEFPGYNEVYCDGSVKDDICAAGVWGRNFALKARLPTGSTIYSAELFAIHSAVEFVSKLPGKYIILTDSLSSVTSLMTVKKGSHYLIYKIAKTLMMLPKEKIILQWVPGHSGLMGNEEADSLAKQALLMQKISTNSLAIEELYQRAKRYYRAEWQRRWNSLKENTKSVTVDVGTLNFSNMERKEQIVLSRLRVQVTKLTHGHYFTKTKKKSCPTCKVPWTVEHLLLTCKEYKEQRRVHVSSSKGEAKNSMTLEFLWECCPPDCIINYIKSIDFMSKI